MRFLSSCVCFTSPLTFWPALAQSLNQRSVCHHRVRNKTVGKEQSITSLCLQLLQPFRPWSALALSTVSSLPCWKDTFFGRVAFDSYAHPWTIRSAETARAFFHPPVTNVERNANSRVKIVKTTKNVEICDWFAKI